MNEKQRTKEERAEQRRQEKEGAMKTLTESEGKGEEKKKGKISNTSATKTRNGLAIEWLGVAGEVEGLKGKEDVEAPEVREVLVERGELGVMIPRERCGEVMGEGEGEGEERVRGLESEMFVACRNSPEKRRFDARAVVGAPAELRGVSGGLRFGEGVPARGDGARRVGEGRGE